MQRGLIILGLIVVALVALCFGMMNFIDSTKRITGLAVAIGALLACGLYSRSTKP